MRRQLPDHDHATIEGLRALGRAAVFARLYIDAGKIRIIENSGEIRALSWEQAKRLCAGESLESVLEWRRKPPMRLSTISRRARSA